MKLFQWKNISELWKESFHNNMKRLEIETELSQACGRLFIIHDIVEVLHKTNHNALFCPQVSFHIFVFLRVVFHSESVQIMEEYSTLPSGASTIQIPYTNTVILKFAMGNTHP